MPEDPASSLREQQHAPDLVGRAREQAQLHSWLTSTRAGQGCQVLVGGEAGIGKTTLVGWLASVASRQGFHILEGRCVDPLATPPYGPWREALAGSLPTRDSSPGASPLRLVPDFATATSQAALFEQVRDVLGRLRASAPLLIVLEDLHWSDPASLELLRFLARRIEALGVLLIGTYRPEQLSPQHPLFHLLPVLVRDSRAERLDLGVFTEEDTQAFVTSRYALPAEEVRQLVTHLQSRTGGLPFYVSEVLRTLETERRLIPGPAGWRIGELDEARVPPLVRQFIAGRLAPLDSTARRLLQVAAVIGPEVPRDVWQAAAGATATEEQVLHVTEQTTGAELLRRASNPRHVRFVHALVQETLYEELSLLRRQQLHQRVAEVLANRPDSPVSLVASHFERADDARAIDWLIRAGEEALALYAARDAVVALTRAEQLAARLGRELPLAAYRTRGVAHALLGAFDRARRDHEDTLKSARMTENQRAEWQALVDLGLLWGERDYQRTGDYLRAALALAQVIGEKTLIAHSLNRMGNWHVNRDEPETALPLHQAALGIFEESGDREGIASTLDLLGLASFLSCDLKASTEYCERAVTLLRDLDDRPRLVSCLVTLASNGGDIDCSIALPVYREATYWIRCGEEGRAIAHAIGSPAGEAFALFVLSMLRSARGDFGRALQDAEDALAIATRIDHRQWAVSARYAAGRARLEFLDVGRAEAELEEALTAARVFGSRLWINAVAAALASLLIANHDLDRAAAILSTIEQSDRPGLSRGQRQCWFARAELDLARGDSERALAILDQLTDSTASLELAPGIPQLLKLRGDALASLPHFEAAEQAYRAARSSAALFGFRPLLWHIDAALAALCHAQGQVADAEAASRSARATIELLAGTLADEHLREQFRTRAVARLPVQSTNDSRPARDARLSPREQDVLQLLVEGKSDREIAEALCISPRTVMRHVTGILNKFGVSSRTAAATLALRRNLV